jgi:hypothetical protein
MEDTISEYIKLEVGCKSLNKISICNFTEK